MSDFKFSHSVLFLTILVSVTQFLSADPGKVFSVYQRAYPGIVTDFADNKIILKTGQVFTCDDGKSKTFDGLIESPDMEDQLSQTYPIGESSFRAPAKDIDPGRIRNEDFFKAIYGGTKQEVAMHLVPVVWMPKSSGKTVMVSKINGVSTQLEKVSKDLDALPENLKKYVIKVGGTFNWRPIAGTKRLSAHAYGIAIDINPDMSSYWQWDKVYSYKNKIPREIVEIFEKHGFIWGGKWYHYDTMHFEYRPELLPSVSVNPILQKGSKSQ